MKLHKYIIGLALLVSSSSCNFLDEEAYEPKIRKQSQWQSQLQ